MPDQGERGHHFIIRNRHKSIKIQAWKRYLLRPNFDINNMRWEINLADDDDFPSVPHADSLNHHYKLVLLDGCGTIYTSDRKPYGRADKKQYQRLMRIIDINGIIENARSSYSERNPSITLPPYEPKHKKQSTLLLSGIQKPRKTFVNGTIRFSLKIEKDLGSEYL